MTRPLTMIRLMLTPVAWQMTTPMTMTMTDDDSDDANDKANGKLLLTVFKPARAPVPIVIQR